MVLAARSAPGGVRATNDSIVGGGKIRHDGRLLELDVLRGLAALAVVLFHYTVRYGEVYGYPSPPAVRVPLGFYGVEVFFCISGFVIFMTLERVRAPLDFVIWRFSRLWPAYLAAILLTFTAVHLFALPGREISGLDALVNVTMIQGLLHVRSVDGAYWSLQVELIFYGWMFLAYLTGALRHIRVASCLALVPPVVYFLARRYLGHDLSYTAGSLLLVPYMPFFVIGLAAYDLHARRGSPVKDLLLMLASIAVIALCHSAVEGAVALGAAAVLCLVVWGRLRVIAAGPLLFLGTISYTLYLLHQNIGYIVIRAAVQRGVPTNLAIGLAVTVSIALAAALTWTVEKPAQRWLRQRYGQRRRRQPVLPVAVARE
jgi:peptidoglycan/LPS O-acetylase OafA/YrhL